jgi:hypothetical protein
MCVAHAFIGALKLAVVAWVWGNDATPEDVFVDVLRNALL